MDKLFVIGLPRTGTTSVSAALLDHGFKVAHTALTKQAFALADVVSDTPCFCDYPQLDALFPGSKFVYLDRAIELWLPSIRMLLHKIKPYIAAQGHLNPVIKRCFNNTFDLLTTESPWSESHLTHCYQQHQQQVLRYFSNRSDLLRIDVSQPGSLRTLLDFVGLETDSATDFPHLNVGNMVTGWKDLKHPNKVNSNASGAERRRFLDYR